MKRPAPFTLAGISIKALAPKKRDTARMPRRFRWAWALRRLADRLDGYRSVAWYPAQDNSPGRSQDDALVLRRLEEAAEEVNVTRARLRTIAAIRARSEAAALQCRKGLVREGDL